MCFCDFLVDTCKMFVYHIYLISHVTDNVVDAAIDSVDHAESEEDSVTKLKVSGVECSTCLCKLYCLKCQGLRMNGYISESKPVKKELLMLP